MAAPSEEKYAKLDGMAEEFAERWRRGERPTLQEFIDRQPDLADDIRELFPALVEMAQAEPDGPPRNAAPAAPSPRHVGEYRIIREVGRGGMGVVYEAEQTSLGRRVALKILPAQIAKDGKALGRFQREARAAAKLHHTNIVPVFEVGQDGDVCYYAMQFIQGQSLDQVVEELRRLRSQSGPSGRAGSRERLEKQAAAVSRVTQALLAGGSDPVAAPAQAALGAATTAEAAPVPSEAAASDSSGSAVLPDRVALPDGESNRRPFFRSVARIGQQVALALAYAHQRGVLHRDVKPSNLLLDEAGVVWVADFGLAKTDDDDLTASGDVVGTFRYMAPERFSGKGDARADVYALGLTLYELLTLRPAFDAADRLALIAQVKSQEPPRPRSLDPRIPRDLETVVLKAISKDPEQRYPAAADLAEDLRRVGGDEPIRARRATLPERAARWCRRNPVVAGLLGAVAVLGMLLLGAGGIIYDLYLAAALKQSEVNVQQAEREGELARKAERERKVELFAARVAEAHASRFSGRIGQRFQTLQAVRQAVQLAHELDLPPAQFDELRNLAIAALTLPDVQMVKEWEGWPAGSIGLAFDDQLERYARSDKQGNITVRRVADDAETAHLAGNGRPVGVDFHEGGRSLLLRDDAERTMKSWRLDAEQPILLAKLPENFKGGATLLTRDHRLLVVFGPDATLSVYDLSSGKRLHDIPFGAGGKPDTGSFSFWYWDMHPWRHELAISTGPKFDPEHNLIRVLDLDQGVVLTELPRSEWGGTMGSVSWCPDGKTLAVGYAQAIVLWDVPSRKPVRVITEHRGGGLAASVGRSGQIMATLSLWAGGVQLRRPQTGKLLLSMPESYLDFFFRAGDDRLYTYRLDGGRIQLWTAEASPVLKVFVRDPARGPVGEYRRSSVHRDGRLLAVGSNQGVSLLDLSNGVDVGRLDLGAALTTQFDPASGDLLTLGALGLLRWPIRSDATDPSRLHVGPPRRLLTAPATDNEFRISRDGRTIAVADYSQALVLHEDQPDRPVILQPTVGVRQQISISPDGQWVATGSHAGGDVHVWEARTGRLVKSLPFNNACLAQFTPDGERLLVGASGVFRFLRVGAWEEAPPTLDKTAYHVGPMPEFSPDGRLLVWERGDGALRLISPTTGRELAVLESPDQGRCGYTTFSPDGTRLITTNMDDAALHVWDLRALRKRLKELDLDWDDEPYPPVAAEAPDHPHFPPLQVEIDDGGLAQIAQKMTAATKLNKEAWLLATGPVEKRDPVHALQLIQKAIQLSPNEPLFLNTLGVVQYRNNQLHDALATLQESLKASHGESDAFDLFFLAMCRHRLGDAEGAKNDRDRAVRWMKEYEAPMPPQWAEELAAFQAEADAVLAGPPGPKDK